LGGYKNGTGKPLPEKTEEEVFRRDLLECAGGKKEGVHTFRSLYMEKLSHILWGTDFICNENGGLGLRLVGVKIRSEGI
jgi:hypothetical protein